MMRSTALVAAVPCIVAVDPLSLLQQHVVIDLNDYDYADMVDYAGEGKRGKETPVAPTPAPAEAVTPAPTPPGDCTAYAGNEAVPAGQVPYVGMTACQSSTWGGMAFANKALTNSVVPVWPGTCTATTGGANDAWWVTFADTYVVNSVQVTNRGACCPDRLQNVDIYVGGQLCANTGNIGDGETKRYACGSSLTGNDVMLRAKHGSILTVCGFSVYGDLITSPTRAPTPLPTPAPTLPPQTPSPTPAGSVCAAYTGTEAQAQPGSQLPYTGMVACQSSNWASPHVVNALANSVIKDWPGTCAAAMGSVAALPSWWVQLAATSVVKSVELTNRQGCCHEYLQNVDIFVGGELCANTGMLAEGETKKYTCSSPLTGNDITLKSTGHTLINLCGFAAYGKLA